MFQNLSQYLSDEQKKMLDLWTELQRVRKQFADMKEKTEKDLNDQRSDFNRVIRSLQGVTREVWKYITNCVKKHSILLLSISVLIFDK